MPRPLLTRALVGVLAAGLLSGCQVTSGGAAGPAAAPAAAGPTRAPAARPSAAAPATTAPRTPARVLLFPRSGGDGDSWKDRAGVEYRLGLVNTPELNECYGNTASAARKRLTRAGFTAQGYATDAYDRRVSVITLADGRNLNVLLAREGYADDRFLAEFRGENPALARQLDAAFAAARQARAGLWGACATSTVPQGIGAPAAPAAPVAPVTTAPAPARGDCDAAYPTVCLPRPGPDLDCGDISERRFAVRPPDPHRFDSDGDGTGCETG